MWFLKPEQLSDALLKESVSEAQSSDLKVFASFSLRCFRGEARMNGAAVIRRYYRYYSYYIHIKGPLWKDPVGGDVISLKS